MAVDLDGTLITGNSLHLYIICGLRRSLARLKFWRTLRILGALALRKLGIWSHLSMKRSVLKTIEPDERLMADFKARFEAMKSPIVSDLILMARSEGTTILLATAAPETYISRVWDGNYVATDALSQCECRGEEKKRRVLEFATQCGLMLDTVVTDHYDDLPLMAVESVKNRYLVDPSAKTLELIGNMDVTVLQN